MTGRDGTRARVQPVVTCANRKTQPVPGTLRLRQVAGPTPAARASAWIQELEGSAASTLPARELYAGEHWQIARELEAAALVAGLDAGLWVCSAGYGLVSVDAPLRPYAATFTPGHPDSVSTQPHHRSQWWAALAGWPGPAAGAPRTLRDLAGREPHAILLVALSATYLAACADDILGAGTELASPAHLTVISVGARTSGPLTRHLAPASARLQPALGGTRQSLNARILAQLLRHPAGALTYPQIRQVLEGKLAIAPPLTRYARALRTDTQVATFIRRQLAADPGATASRLLREFRDRGYACEQSRFATIYRASGGS